MAANSRIEWTDVTWNPVTGCTPVSPGCLNCYAARDAVRMAGNRNPKISGRYKGLAVVRDGRPVFNGTIRLHEDRLADPLRWRKPRMVFVNSQSDLFHDDVPFEFIDRVFAVMALCQQHTFQVLTKRPERMTEYMVLRGKNADYWKRSVPVGYSLQFQQFSLVRFPLSNVWVGTSAENQECLDERLPHLLRVPAAVRFLSLEPLLGPIDLSKWLGYYPPHEGDREDRTVCVQSGPGREVRDNPDWRSVARSPEAPRGPDNEQRIQDGQNNEAATTGDDAGASSRVSPLQRSNSAGVDDKPQKRRTWRQQAGKPRIGDVCRAGSPCGKSLGEEAEGAMRRKERHGETNREGGAGDSTAATRGRASQVDSVEFRGERQNNQQDCAWGTLGIHQIIVGGESGPHARATNLAWHLGIVRQCKTAGVPCFVKQVGAKPYLCGGHTGNVTDHTDCGGESPACRFIFRDRKGGDPSEWPAELRVREWPKA